MKKNLVLFVTIFLSLLPVIINAQSIWFLNPTNGETLTGTGSQTTVYMQLQFNYNLSGSPHLTDHYIKLFRPPYSTQKSGQGGGITSDYNLPIGTYTWRLELWECYVGQGCLKKAEQTVTFYVKHKMWVSNNFQAGIIKIDGQTIPSGTETHKFTGDNLLVGAIDQYYEGYYRLWNQSGVNNSEWQRKPWNQGYSPIYGGTSRDFNYTVVVNDNRATVSAGLRKICKANFQNSFTGVGNGGIIKVNNTQYNSPTNQFDVVELNPVTATAVYQVIDDIGYSFDHWSDGSTEVTHTFNPGSTQTYTAYFKGKPLTANRQLHTGTVYNQPIVLYWNEHLSTGVTQYQIWRQVKHNGVMGNPNLIATVNRGTTSYVDDDYVLTKNYSNDLLYYDVKPYYSIENTYSDNDWFAVYGKINPKLSDTTVVSGIVFENSLSNYPNPFNPATNISYSIKEAGQVNIKVFDLLGQQISELVNEGKEAGTYTISFDGSELPSGVYIYTISSSNYLQSRKMLLMK